MQDGLKYFERKMRDASCATANHIVAMTQIDSTIDPSDAWAAVLARDRRYDGKFVTGVLTTGIYCRPSCAARHPARKNVRFFADGAEARKTGLRPCLRCNPDDVARDELAIAKATTFITARDGPVLLEEVAAVAGYAPHHFHRIFKRATGLTPAGYARALRARRAQNALATEANVTEAVYEAGYSGPSRFYAHSKARLGMTPSVWRKGGQGAIIRWTIVSTSLGMMLVAATDKGICRLSFDEDEAVLRRRFPQAEIVEGGDALTAIAARAVEAVEQPARMPNLPLDVRGTVFQEAVWQELSRIPAGETASYAALAARAGNPGAVRAAGSACGANPVAVLIPCHRAKRTDGSLGGYAYGLDRKEKLLAREAKDQK